MSPPGATGVGGGDGNEDGPDGASIAHRPAVGPVVTAPTDVMVRQPGGATRGRNSMDDAGSVTLAPGTVAPEAPVEDPGAPADDGPVIWGPPVDPEGASDAGAEHGGAGDGDGPGGGGPDAPSRGRWARLWRGRPEDPVWARPALFALLAATGVLYLWGLGAEGWANSFYSAAVQAGSRSLKAAFFGSSDASNFITVDKPPVSLWPMELSVRLFGLNAWSILVPQAIEGVAAVALLYATVKRWFGPGAGLLAGAVLATTPVATLMFRFNNPDSLLVLLMVGAAYATVRALEDGRTRWLVLMAALVGTGFITKMLQAYLVMPSIAAVYLLAGPPRLLRRIWQLAVAGVVLVVASGWWVAAVQLTPAADRPYVGGSQDNNLLNLIFGYNGFGRLSGNETGSVGGGFGRGGTSMWGPTGWLRMFNADFGSQISWLLPAALLSVVICLIVTIRRPRTDRTRAAVILWGGTLLVTGLTFSLAQGIIHPYYSVALAPAAGALVGIASVEMGRRRSSLWARAVLAAGVVASAVWAYELLDRSPTWYPVLRTLIVIGGLVVAVGFVLPRSWTRRWLVVVAVVGGLVVLAAPVAYSVQTVATTHGGALPTAGPAVTGNGFGPGGGFGGFGGGRFGGLGRFGLGAGTNGGGRLGGGGRGFGGGGFGGGGGGFGGAPGGGSANPPGAPGPSQTLVTPAQPVGGAGAFGGAGRAFGGFGGFGGAAGSLLNGSTPGKAITALLATDASKYRWVAAADGSNVASGYQLATQDPVMSIGGFNGTDPAPTLAQFQSYVKAGEIHYYISGGGFAGLAGLFGGSSTSTSQISTWVKAHYTAQTVDGVTVYDLTAPTAGTS